MELPAVPLLQSIESISPSFYNAAIICDARAAWQRFGNRYSLPSSTGAMLGSAFHLVMEMGNRGELPPGDAGLRLAKAEFDKEADRLFAQAHPLLRAKYATPLKIPFYSIRRSRAATLAVRASATAEHRPATHTSSPPSSAQANFSRLVE